MARLLIALLFFADKTVAWRGERYAGSDFWYALAILSLVFAIQAACWPEHAPTKKLCPLHRSLFSFAGKMRTRW